MLLRFLGLELKNSIKMMRIALTGIILFAVLLTAVIAAVSFVMEKNNPVPIKVATVMDDDATGKMLVRYISQIESVKSVSEFVTMDEEEAFEALDDNELNVVIKLPDHFFDDVNMGYNTPLDIHIRPDADLLTEVFASVLKSGVGYVQTGEALAYAYIDVRSEYDLDTKFDGTIGDHVAYEIAQIVMHRMRIFDEKVISPYGNLDNYHFYFISVTVIILLFLATSFGFMYRKDTLAFENNLKPFGVGPLKISFIKTLIISMHLFVASCIICALSFIPSKMLDITMFELSLGHIYAMLFICLYLAVIINMIYSLAGNDYSVHSALLVTIVILLMMSGLLVPMSRLPKIISKAAFINPLYHLGRFMTEAIYGDIGIVSLLGMLIMTLIALLLTYLPLRKR
ncbi:MAG: ABC transporter permease [Lachnospiraceae bacterium]|nr:ABC transporter permease [Lachnospiraceae bacterium]